MGWNVSTRSGSSTGNAPAGLHPAVLVGLIDLGTQVEHFEGKPRNVPRVLFVWELVVAPRPAGSQLPVTAHREFTVSMADRAALRKAIQGRIGRTLPDGDDYDISQELGKPCFLNIVADGDYTKVEAVNPVPGGIVVPASSVPPFLFRVADYQNGKTVFPPWVPTHVYGIPLREKLASAKEVKRTEAVPF